MGTYEAVLKSTISTKNHFIYFEIDVVEANSNNDYFIGFICMAVYGVIVTVSAVFIIWKLKTNPTAIKQKSA